MRLQLSGIFSAETNAKPISPKLVQKNERFSKIANTTRTKFRVKVRGKSTGFERGFSLKFSLKSLEFEIPISQKNGRKRFLTTQFKLILIRFLGKIKSLKILVILNGVSRKIS